MGKGPKVINMFAILSSTVLLTLLFFSTQFGGVSSSHEGVVTGPQLTIDPDPNPNLEYEEDPDKEFREFCHHQELGRYTPEKVNKEDCKRIAETDFHDEDIHMLFMIFLVLLYGAIVRSIMRYFHMSLPYTVVLMVSGMAVGSLARYTCYEMYTFTALARLHSKLILFTFLPVLLFESSFSIPGHVFMKACGQVLILAAPGMLFCTFLTGFVCYTFFDSYNWSLTEAIFFGSIISATDPVAVVAILKELGVSETLGVIVDGESLLNDGVAILLYEVLKEILDQIQKGEEMDAGETVTHIISEFFQIAVGGPAFGFLMGKITIFALSKIFNDAVVKITITLVSAYLTYYIGEDVLRVSGVMAVVLLGITMSSEKTCISPDTEHEVHEFWGMLGHLANTVLFFTTGVIITERATRNIEWDDLFYLLLLYCALNLIRFMMLLTLSPILTRIGYGMPWQNMIVLMWGGLRGAVGICLSLEMYEDVEFCKEQLGPKILIQTAGIVLLTLVVNGTTTRKLLDLLKLTEISSGRMEEMSNALKIIGVAQKKALVMLRHDRFLADACWSYVGEHTKIENPYRNAQVADLKSNDNTSIVSLGPENITNKCPTCHTDVPNQPTNDELKVMTEEARLRVLKAMKISFWAHFERGVLTEEAVLILAGTAESIADKPLYMIHSKDLKKYWTIRGFFPWLRERIVHHFGEEENNAVPPLPKQRWRSHFWWLATRVWFEYLIIIFVVINVIFIIVELALESKIRNTNTCSVGALPEYKQTYQISNSLFAIIYSIEFIVKVTGTGIPHYWSSKWNCLDFFVLIVTVGDITAWFAFGCGTKNQPGLSKVFTVIRAIRICRCLKLLRPLVPAMMTLVNGRINTQLFLGYDVALGFIVASDDCLKFLPQMVDNKRVFNKIKQNVERERMETVREMGILQKDHPGIAIAVKTRHASRSVLNQMKATLSELRVDGLLDEKENDLLTVVLEERMKRLWSSPSYIAPPAPELLLNNLNWVFGHNELRDYIFNYATLLQFEASDVIAGFGDPPCGIYVIVSGKVKLIYKPTLEIIEQRQMYGVIPAMEIFKDIDFDKRTEDFFSSGTVIGESACLTGRSRASSVICETEGVTAYHIPLSVIQDALVSFNDRYNSQEVRLWRSCGMRRASCILSTVPAYQAVPKEKLEMLLERSCVPIGPEFDTITVPSYVQDVVVFEGTVENVLTGEVYTAPSVVPKSCTTIKMKPNPKTVNRVLLVLAENQGPEEGDDDEDDLARCMLASKNQRRQSLQEDHMLPELEQKSSLVNPKDKQRRYSVTVNFGVRQKNRRRSSILGTNAGNDHDRFLRRHGIANKDAKEVESLMSMSTTRRKSVTSNK